MCRLLVSTYHQLSFMTLFDPFLVAFSSKQDVDMHHSWLLPTVYHFSTLHFVYCIHLTIHCGLPFCKRCHSLLHPPILVLHKHKYRSESWLRSVLEPSFLLMDISIHPPPLACWQHIHNHFSIMNNFSFWTSFLVPIQWVSFVFKQYNIWCYSESTEYQPHFIAL